MSRGEDEDIEPEKYSRFEHALKVAERKGLVVIEPADNELFIDIDDEDGLRWFHINIKTVQENLACSWVQQPSPSGDEGRFHIVVTFLPKGDGLDFGPVPVKLTFEQRILLQALLGSDRKREALSWQRALRGDDKPTLFFEKKDWS